MYNLVRLIQFGMVRFYCYFDIDQTAFYANNVRLVIPENVD